MTSEEKVIEIIDPRRSSGVIGVQKYLRIYYGPFEYFDPYQFLGSLSPEEIQDFKKKWREKKTLKKLRKKLDQYIETLDGSNKCVCKGYIKLCFDEYSKNFTILKKPSYHQMSSCCIPIIEDKHQFRSRTFYPTHSHCLQYNTTYRATGKYKKVILQFSEYITKDLIDRIISGYLDNPIEPSSAFIENGFKDYVSLYIMRGVKRKRKKKE